MKNKFSIKGFLIGFLIFILNSFDGIVTSIVIKRNEIKELNPIINFLIEKIGDWFLFPKILLGLILFILLSIYWDLIKIKIAVFIVLLIYFLLTIYHIVGIIYLLI